MAGEGTVPVELYATPGHLVRRVQQTANAIFAEEVTEGALTPPQHALLVALEEVPGADQITLSRMVGIDRSTVADVVNRLRRRGLVSRSRDDRDARRNTVRLTERGLALVQNLRPAIERAQLRLIAPLDDGERSELVRLLTKLATAHDDSFREVLAEYGPGPRHPQGPPAP
jgi:DNA-binding MarR family transcriptional regulator